MATIRTKFIVLAALGRRRNTHNAATIIDSFSNEWDCMILTYSRDVTVPWVSDVRLCINRHIGALWSDTQLRKHSRTTKLHSCWTSIRMNCVGLWMHTMLQLFRPESAVPITCTV